MKKRLVAFLLISVMALSFATPAMALSFPTSVMPIENVVSEGQEFTPATERTQIHLSLFLILLALLCYSEIDCRNQIKIVENPTFTGEVVGKETRYFPPWAGASLYQLRQLHIVGEYFDGEEIIQIDRVFAVSASWYSRYEVGDFIGNTHHLTVRGFNRSLNI